jgi:hypothetical protein
MQEVRKHGEKQGARWRARWREAWWEVNWNAINSKGSRKGALCLCLVRSVNENSDEAPCRLRSCLAQVAMLTFAPLSRPMAPIRLEVEVEVVAGVEVEVEVGGARWAAQPLSNKRALLSCSPRTESFTSLPTSATL